MARGYNLKIRGEKQAETRRRIVEAAIDLHGSVGPARTSLSMVAERAGVQRNTLYAHFPDERSLGLACSGLFMERAPPPDPAGWGVGTERLERGLAEIYAWYERTAEMTGCVLRDAEGHALTREIAELRMGPVVGGWHAALGEVVAPGALPLLHLALSFHTWRALVREAGMDNGAAAAVMAKAVRAAG